MHNINTSSKFTLSWNVLYQRNGGQCSSSKCLYLLAGEIEREEFCIDYGRWVSLDKRERERAERALFLVKNNWYQIIATIFRFKLLQQFFLIY